MSTVPPAANVPTEDEVDAARTLRDLRAQEGAIMRVTREHEEGMVTRLSHLPEHREYVRVIVEHAPLGDSGAV